MRTIIGTTAGWTPAWIAAAALLVGGCSATIDTARQNPHPAAMPAAVSPVDETAFEAGDGVLDDSWTATRRPWKFADYDGWHVQTPNYDIYTTIKHDTVLNSLPNFYEVALHNYLTAFGPLPQPKQRFETFMFQDRRQWAAKTRQILPDQSDLFMRLGRGGFSTRGIAILYYIDYGRWPRDTFAIASHEGWHQYTQKTFRQQLPIWLEEGIATYMEGYSMNRSTSTPTFQPHRNRERSRTLRDALRRNQLIPLAELMRRSPQSFLENSKDALLVYYAQVWGLVHFLNEGEQSRYRGGLHDLLQDAANGRFISRVRELASNTNTRSRRYSSGRIGAEALEVYFNTDMSEFERQYLAYITELVGMTSTKTTDATEAATDDFGDAERVIPTATAGTVE